MRRNIRLLECLLVSPAPLVSPPVFQQNAVACYRDSYREFGTLTDKYECFFQGYTTSFILANKPVFHTE